MTEAPPFVDWRAHAAMGNRSLASEQYRKLQNIWSGYSVPGLKELSDYPGEHAPRIPIDDRHQVDEAARHRDVGFRRPRHEDGRGYEPQQHEPGTFSAGAMAGTRSRRSKITSPEIPASSGSAPASTASRPEILTLSRRTTKSLPSTFRTHGGPSPSSPSTWACDGKGSGIRTPPSRWTRGPEPRERSHEYR